MAKQTLIWTALPAGVSGGKLRLSVMLSPRLQSSRTKPTLDEFPDLLTWPTKPVSFVVQFAKGPTLQAQRVGSTDPDLWQALFPATTYVRSYVAEDQSRSTVVSYPVRNVLNYIDQRYRRLALEWPTRLPPAGLLLDSDYFGAIRVQGSIRTQLLQTREIMRRDQARLAASLIQAFNEQSPAAAVPVPIAPPPAAGPGRDDGNLPPSLREHIDGTIGENQRGVGQQIGNVFGRFANQQGSAPLPDSQPTSRSGEGAIPELPIFLPIEEVPDPLRDFLRAGLFQHGMAPELSGAPGDREVQPMPVLPDIDFHQSLSLLADYPSLMRTLGTVIDLEVPLPADWTTAIPDASLIRVLPAYSPAVQTVDVTPWTHYTLDKSGGPFLARPRPTNPEIAGGLLNLQDEKAFLLIQHDPDSAASAVLNAINRGLDDRQPEKLSGLPALRSGGLSLVRSGAELVLLQTFVMSTLRNSMLEQRPEGIAFYAEDLVQGYRPDVWSDKSLRWHSLTGRVGSYNFVDLGRVESMEDEGWVSLATTQAVGVASADLHLHQMLFNWQGWSLATPPPEQAIGDDGEYAAEEEHPLTQLRMRVDFVPPPRSLPMLRYGVSYRVRARTVDLAGNSLPFQANAGFDAASQTFTYRRLEPVGSPHVVPLEDLAPASAADPAVRESKGETLKLVVKTDAGNTFAGTADRHVAPPRTSLKQAEIHGAFDTPGGLDRYLYEEAMNRGGELPAFHSGTQLPVPYLADPIARYAALERLPGAPDVTLVDFNNAKLTWLDTKAFRLRLDSGTGAPDWNSLDRILTVKLAPGEQTTVKLSCAMDEADVDLFYLWSEMAKGLTEEGRDTEVAYFRNLARQGQHWMLTPYKELKLVHAVQKPLRVPEWKPVMAGRSLGESTAMISGQVVVDAKSTRAVNVKATWQEPVDDPTAGDPTVHEIEGFGFQEQVSHLRRDLMQIHHRHDFGTTKHLKVKLTATAASRFKEYFPEVEDLPENFQVTGELDGVQILNTARPAAPQVVYAVPTFGWETQQPVDDLSSPVVNSVRRLRRGGGLRIYLERPWYSSGEGELLGVVLPEGLTSRERVPKAQQAYVTHWGQDPLWRAKATYPAPRPEHFRNAEAVQTGLTLEELGAATTVSVVGVPVTFDPGRKLWYADIELDAGPAYFPFLRLALVRYQPHSVAGAHLSRVTLTDFLQVAPDRAASVTRTARDRQFQVTVGGETYERGSAGPAILQVAAEYTDRATPGLKWMSAGATYALQRRSGYWTGTVTVPVVNGASNYRLVITEYEQYPADGNRTERRLVYADVVDLGDLLA